MAVKKQAKISNFGITSAIIVSLWTFDQFQGHQRNPLEKLAYICIIKQSSTAGIFGVTSSNS